MRALITGGAGFIGSHLTQALLNAGFAVSCVDNLSTSSPSHVQRFNSHPKYRFHYANVEDFMGLDALVQESDVIFHLAATVGVKNVVDNPIYCIENNLFGTCEILRLAGLYKKRIITFSTSEVYGKTKKFPFSEEDDLVFGSAKKLRWAYAASKLLDDYLAQAYFIQKNTPVTIVRLFNTIGQHQVGHYGMVVPRFFEAAIRNEPIPVHGTGSQTRCFTDVRDVTRALIQLIDKKHTHGELINLGNSFEISIETLARKIVQVCGSKSYIEKVPHAEVYGENFEDMDRRLPDNSKLKNILSFEFQYTLEDTLKWIHEEFRHGRTVSTAPTRSYEFENATL